MVIENMSGEVVTATDVQPDLGLVMRRFFVADQHYFRVTYQQENMIRPKRTNRRMVLYKGQVFGDKTFIEVFGVPPEEYVRDPTPTELQAAVNTYFANNPVSAVKGDKGDAGTPATDQQIQAAVSSWMSAHPVAATPALSPTDQQIIAAVSTYMTANAALFKGAPGTPADTSVVTAHGSAITALQTVVNALKAIIGAQGEGTLQSSLLVGVVGTMTITWATPLPDTNYFAIGAAVDGSNGILDLEGPTTNKTVNSCTVAVKNVGSLAAGNGVKFRALAVRY